MGKARLECHLLTFHKASMVPREALVATETFSDLALRAAQQPVGGCAKCTKAFCDQPTKNFRDQTNCKCGPCKNNKKPDPSTNDRCIPDCQGNEAANGPKDADGDPTCKKCPDGQKPDEDRTDCIKSDCPTGQVPDGKKPDGSTNCKQCPGGKTNPEQTKCADDDRKCPAGQVPDGPAKSDGTPNCRTCPGGKTDPTQTKCDGDQDCRPGQKKQGDQCVNDKEKKDKLMKDNLDRKVKLWNDKQEKKTKKARGGKCLLIVGLILTPSVLSDITSGVKGSDLYDFSTGGFDQGFVDQDWQFDWPQDIPWKPDINLDDPKFMQPWFDYVSKMQAAKSDHSCPCAGFCNGKRSTDSLTDYHIKHKRCPPKVKRDLFGNFVPAERDDPNGFLPSPSDLEGRSVHRRDFVPDPNDPDGHHQAVHSANPHKRQFQFLIPIFDLLLDFAETAMAFISRAVQATGRIAEAFNKGERVLKVVKDGSKFTRDQMKNAAGKIRENKSFNQCLQGLAPL